MLFKRILSTFLAVLTLVGSLSLAVGAAQEANAGTSTEPVYEYNTSKAEPTMDYLTGKYTPPEGGASFVVETQAQKLQTMDLRLEQDGYRMYVDEYSGEVAVECIATGDVMFSNPYDVGSNANVPSNDKPEMLSQIIIEYNDTSTGTADTYYSYTHAVKAGDVSNQKNSSQVAVRYIKNGIRVEYSIGRVSTRYLVPEVMSADDFEENLLVGFENAMKEIEETIAKLDPEADAETIEALQAESFQINTIATRWFKKFLFVDDYIASKNYRNEETAKKQRELYLASHPQTAYGDVYEFTTSIENEIAKAEKVIKTYCTDFTYEMMDAAYAKLGYAPDEQNQPLFNVALEYTINEDGFSVRLPANGIRFDESIYRLEDIQILPYMGAGKNPNSGYTFFPDGSGALFDFETLAKKTSPSIYYGDIYGIDYGFYNMNTIAPHNEVIRYPVFGIVEDLVDETSQTEHTRGFLAIVEEGESMMTLKLTHNPKHYNSVSMSVNPRPYDNYPLSKTGVENEFFPVVSPRKYTGSFKIRYIMLADPDVVSDENHFETSYVGMAKAYRSYLEDNEVLTRLTAADVKEDIPLYIETFGAIETTEKFLSIPYSAMKALTSFEDVRTMYDELAALGITNVNFVLTGYTKGGLNIDQVPYYLKWDKSVEKEIDFEELVEYAKEKGFGLYPDFDFAFASTNKMFDGLTLDKHAVKTVDDRYISKREYSATRQAYVSYFELAMSPAYFSHFYEKLTENYKKADPTGIAVTSIGQYLNSDFDEDEPYHREDSKEFTAEAFKYFSENYANVLTAGGNAYTWKYVDYITDISTDSSHNTNCTATVPFLGIVLHGYVQTAGEPINMEGNIDYAMLRSIENGAALKFILSYRNTEKLKEYTDTSKYYSVRYDIWRAELLEKYNEINNLLKDLQLCTIEEHEFINGVRVPDSDEVLADYEKALLDAVQNEIDTAASEKETERLQVFLTRQYLTKELGTKLPETLATIKTNFDTNVAPVKDVFSPIAITAATAKINLDAATVAKENEETEETINLYNRAKAEYDTAQTKLLEASKTYYDGVMAQYELAVKAYEDSAVKYEFAQKNFSDPVVNAKFAEDEKVQMQAVLADLADEYAALKANMEQITADKDALLAKIPADQLKEYEDAYNNAKVNEVEDEGFNVYEVTTNTIVREVFENGRELILNFNNYTVKVELNGASYTIGAYSYIVIK